MQSRGHQPQRIRLLGRLSAVIPTVLRPRYCSRLAVLLAGAAVSCEERDTAPADPSSGRSIAITAKPQTAAPPATTKAQAPRAPRALCTTPTEPKDFPKTPLSTVRGTGGPSLPASPGLGGRYTWVNFWAAWCGPCKEEMPLLTKWETEFRAAGANVDVMFVSLDDDERELSRFLDSQKAVRSTYHLPDGGSRAGWLGEINIKPEPTLPIHALFGPDRKLRCVIEGAVEESDKASLLAFFRKP